MEGGLCASQAPRERGLGGSGLGAWRPSSSRPGLLLSALSRWFQPISARFACGWLRQAECTVASLASPVCPRYATPSSFHIHKATLPPPHPLDASQDHGPTGGILHHRFLSIQFLSHQVCRPPHRLEPGLARAAVPWQYPGANRTAARYPHRLGGSAALASTGDANSQAGQKAGQTKPLAGQAGLSGCPRLPPRGAPRLAWPRQGPDVAGRSCEANAPWWHCHPASRRTDLAKRHAAAHPTPNPAQR